MAFNPADGGTALPAVHGLGSGPRAALPTVRGLAFGGDYNPEQWPETVWTTDAKLMRDARVNLVTVGVFSWSMLEPQPGRFVFDWLDRVLDLLAEHDVAVDLATATASPPPWFSRAYPNSLPVDADGVRQWYGSRQAYCPSSPEYRAAATELVERLATRYTGHPALVLWHVNNEYGCHVPRCWCDTSAEAFRGWLRRRYTGLDELNEAWGTAFWSQRYGDWAEIIPPRRSPSFANPTQQLDFYRFCSDELLDCFRAERDLLHRLSPGVPVTTNFMAGMNWAVDLWSWAGEVDVVSTDFYPAGESTRSVDAQIAFAADLTRSLAGGRPWLLMEHATSAVNWQPRNLATPPGRLRRDSLARLARGADGLLYFQWRASRSGAEKWHSGMLPHAGPETKVHREVAALGAELAGLAEIAGSEVVADTAILLDFASVWAQEHPARPSVDLDPVALAELWHAAALAAGITCDFARPEADLSRYRLVLVPALYLVGDAAAANLVEYVAAGGTALVGPFSGVVDDRDHVRLGGYPGAWLDLLGLRVEEHFPLPAGGTVALSDGTTGRIWTELAEVGTAEVLAAYADGPLAGAPALTRNDHGDGVAYYLTTHLSDVDLLGLLATVAVQAGASTAAARASGVETVLRRHPGGADYTFLVNHTDEPVELDVPGRVLTGAEPTPAGVRLPAGGFAVVRTV